MRKVIEHEARKRWRKNMCYNCKCDMRENDMGKGHAGVDPEGKAITEKTFQVAADAFGMSIEDTKKEVFKMLKDQLETHEHTH